MNKRDYAPEGWPVLIPRIVAHQAEQLIEFVKHVFGATGDYQSERPTVLEIGDSMIMISEAGVRDSMPAFLYVYVEDTDEIAVQFKQEQGHWKNQAMFLTVTGAQ